MSTLCIGGVCVPYTAVVPLFFICLRWVLQKAVEFGILPKSIQDKIFPQQTSSKYAPVQNGEGDSTTTASTGSSAGIVTTVEDEDQFREVLKAPQTVVKFTADWCRPCKEIHPEFVALAGKFSKATFCTVDVDELDEVAAEYNIAMMPTFLVFKEGKLSESFSGIDLLEAKISKALA